MRRLLPWLAAFLVPLAVVVGLTWPLALHLADWHLLTPFGDSHVWVFDQVADELLRGHIKSLTCEAGYPVTRSMRSIGWVPLLLFVPLRALLGALAAANLLQLVSLPISALAASWLVRRWTQAPPWTAAGLGAAWALCPTLLATLGTGEIPNTQAWVLPLFLLALDGLARARGRVAILRDAVAVGLIGLITSFTSPYYALAFPLIAGVWALAWWRRPVRGLTGLGVLALSLLPARAWFRPGIASGGASIFQPAMRGVGMGNRFPQPAPVATLDGFLRFPDHIATSPWESTHVAYLGAALVVLGLAGLIVRGRAWRAGGLLLLGGAALAMGPFLAIGARYVLMDGRPLALPMRLFEQLGYPTGMGGLYYRYAIISTLGLALLGGGALARRRRGAGLAWLVVALGVVDGVAASGPYWPRPAVPVAGLEALRRMPGEDGAVLELPLQGPADALFGQGALLRAVFHRRPTTALPRAVWRRRSPLRAAVARAMVVADPAGTLREQGFRYVLLPTDLAAFSDPSEELLREKLGTPWVDADLLIWDLGSAESSCRPERFPEIF